MESVEFKLACINLKIHENDMAKYWNVEQISLRAKSEQHSFGC